MTKIDESSTYERPPPAAATSKPGAESPLIRKLRNFRLFDRNCERELQQLFDRSSEFERHSDLVRDGDEVQQVFVLLSGWCARYKIVGDGSRQIISFLLPGDVFPLHATTTGQMDHGVAALTRCEVAAADASSFNNALLRKAKLAQAFWWATLADKGVLRAWVVNLGQRSAYCRVAHVICELNARLQMVGLSNNGCFQFPVTQEEIADAVGMTTVHANRILQQLRQDGLIKIEQKRLTILDADGLCELADFNSAYLNPV